MRIGRVGTERGEKWKDAEGNVIGRQEDCIL